MEAKELQQMQADYDSRYWEVSDSDFEKTRHITLHMGKLLGKLTGYCERKEHHKNFSKGISTEQVVEEVIPDMLVYALQLANIFNVKIDEQYLRRLEENKKRLRPVR